MLLILSGNFFLGGGRKFLKQALIPILSLPRLLNKYKCMIKNPQTTFIYKEGSKRALK